MMTTLETKAVFAGLAFGIWPLFLNRSGLNGNVASLAFELVTTMGVLPFALASGRQTLSTAHWNMVIFAGVLGACGLLLFNGMLSQAKPKEVGSLFVITLLVQTAIPALYQALVSQHISISKAIGFAAALVAACLLA